MARSISPLRYPGGKSCMLDLATTLLDLNGFNQPAFAEPFAGGCGLSLALLFTERVSEIYINDLDGAVWAFWHVLLNDIDALCDKVASTPVTMDEWHNQQEIYRQHDRSDLLDLGYSFFFLNRTNRSGIIKGAGVIGGQAQNGQYKLGCRYNPVELINRMRLIHARREQIHLTNLDALTFINRAARTMPSNSMMFIDPPYYAKGGRLYTRSYAESDHRKLAAGVAPLTMPWIMTYDDVPALRALYAAQPRYLFDIGYSLHSSRIATELLITSTGLVVSQEMLGRQITE